MPREANAVDFWRGFALITIYIDHIPGLVYSHYTLANFSIADAADLFVFLAGWSLRLMAQGRGRPRPTHDVVIRLFGRSLEIYLAQVLITMLAIALLAASAILLHNPLLLQWHNAAAVFNDPVPTHIGLALLTHQLGYFNILPLYVVLMLMAPFFALIDRLWPPLLLPLSFALYLFVLAFRITLPSWPVGGAWFFNPLAWQLLFVLGFVLGNPDSGPGAFARRHIVGLRAIGVPIVILGVLIHVFSWWPDPTKVPDPKLFFIADKTYVTPMRLIQFLALIAVFSVAYPYIRKLTAVPVARGPVNGMIGLFAMLGRNSLQVFCVGSLLSLAAQVARYVEHGTVGTDTLVVLLGIIIMAFAAWLTESRDRLRPPAPAVSPRS
ncbi:MAG TPA: OpgC domain-containing protein [Pseudolabrys sp.]|nr:OpgC domain-containing protein [Pseudolabrys sp.]